ncbi:MAG TPA: type II toxin-antitoxin system VapC family toxin [Bryobacteraceae bacterium]
MNYLLDTNVVSEWIKPRPDPGVIKWLAEADEDRVFLSVITLAEVRYGIERMAMGAQRDHLGVWLRDELTGRFEGRILPVDPAVAEAWGQLIARAQATGRTLGIMDGFVSAIAALHQMTVVTRNVTHFRDLGHPVFNPWTS